MPIQVENQYKLIFSIDGKSDFITEDQLQNYVLIEEAGGALPTFELAFQVSDETMIPLLHEGGSLIATLEDGAARSVSSELFIVTSHILRQTTTSCLVQLKGLYNAPQYNLKQRMRITEPKTSIEVIRSIASNHFEVDIDASDSKDQQVWIQHNISDRRFITDCWMHCNIPDSFPLIGITSEGKFRLRDAASMARKGPNIEIGLGKQYVMDPQHKINTDSGLLNSLYGYGVEQIETQIEVDNTISTVKTTQPVLNIFTIGEALTRNADAPNRKLSPVTWSSDNVNPEYWEAYRRNMACLMAYSSTKLVLNIRNVHVDASVLDLALFTDPSLTSVESSENYSGLYVVTKIARNLHNRNLNTVLHLVREGGNRQQGTLR